jgi:hypothetical protein
VISIVTWKWHRPGYRSIFRADAVNVLRNMFERHLKIPHRVFCVTDEPRGIDPRVEIVDITKLPSYEWLQVRNPSSPQNPSCYVRLFMFSDKAGAIFGPRMASVDLDVVLTGDVTPIFDRDVDFAIWGGQAAMPQSSILYNWYNGSLFMLKAGARRQVYDRFDPRTSPRIANFAKCRGSDQGWIAYVLGPREHQLGERDGIYSYRGHIAPAGGILPPTARFVAFHGRHDPWHSDVQARHSWVREHYR